jgi:hypothetical protein
VGFRSLSSSEVGLFFIISITVGTRFFVVPGVGCGREAGVACFHQPSVWMSRLWIYVLRVR